MPDFAGVLFAVLVIRDIVCFPLTPRRLSALGAVQFVGEIAAALKNLIPGCGGVCTLWGVLSNHLAVVS